uniref:50S ribosomal protein L9, chloroplastic n=1 Tax=Isochrysis galbana TaxID=37099 RepID=Q2IA87_ISOGA|nr:chloroplast 50S ribosomal protein L9 [Isochrysis galbana]
MLRAVLLLGLAHTATALTIGVGPALQPRVAATVMMAKKAAPKGKDVQVILTGEIKGLGSAGDLVAVKPAYAQNFILTKGLGKMATPEMLKQIAEQQAADAATKAEALALAERHKKTLDAVFGSQGLFIKKKVGPDGAMFGSITASEVADIIEERAGVTVDKKGITTPKLKAVGSEVISVVLHKRVEATIKISVVPATL